MTLNRNDIVNNVAVWMPVIGMLMLISAIPYGWSWYQNLSCFVLGIGYLAYILVYKTWRNVRWDRTKWMYVVMLAIWAMYPLRQLFDTTPPTDFFWQQVHRHEWFLYIGIAGFLGFPDKLQLKHVAYVMLLTSVFMLAHCIGLYVFTDELIGYDEMHMPLKRFDELRLLHIHSHMVMNLYLNTAVLFGLYALRQDKEWWKRVFIGFGIVCALAIIWLSIGRIGKVTSMFILAVYLLYRLLRVNQWAAIGSAVTCIVIGIVCMFLIPEMRVKSLQGDPREAIWNYSWRMIKEKPFTGYGVSTLGVQYVEEAYQDSVMLRGYIEPIIYTYPVFSEQGKTMNTHHPHNAFLMYWLAVGIIGVILLLALFGTAACLPVGQDKVYLWLMLLAIFLQSLTEPIGFHLLAQFIAVMLFVWERTHPHAECQRACR